MINVVGFSKCYEQFLAVDNLSFSIQPGQVLGLVGRNGAGKTTTLRSINGIIPPSQGTIEVDGFSIDKNPIELKQRTACLLYTSPSPRDRTRSRMPSSA